jgi:hypothetical protein
MKDMIDTAFKYITGGLVLTSLFLYIFKIVNIELITFVTCCMMLTMFMRMHT